METIQTALTGVDIYYWFVAGFGNVERLGNSHFAPIDVPIISAVISFIVQGYFCYRIWVLNKRSSWICWIIAVVCIPDCPRILCASDVFLNTGCGDSISRSDMGEHQSQYYTHFRQVVFLTQRLVTHGWEVCGLQDSTSHTIRTHTRFGLIGHTTSYSVVLVMVDIECLRGRSDRSGDDAAGTASHYWILFYIDRDPFGQLRRASGNFSSFVLIRVVRLTIETNALTGTCLSENPT